MSIHVILAAGGSGTRMHSGKNKIFVPVRGHTVLERSMRLFDGLADNMMIVCREEEKDEAAKAANLAGVSYSFALVTGGDTRQHSVLNGLKALQAADNDIVLVHDAARCFTPRSVIESVIGSCIEYGSGIPGIPAVNTMKYCDADSLVTYTADRTNLYEIQTPQGFRYRALLRAYFKAEKDSFPATDDASVMEHAAENVRIVRGSRMNFKLTEKDDLMLADAVVSGGRPCLRIGMGYDVHRLVKNRKLILCGVEIPHSLGLLGHSDADVALHALMDAMLGAACLGDIGQHFPDTSEKYSDISSLKLLEETMKMIESSGYVFVNADITIAAQKPRIAPYIAEMRECICKVIRCDPDLISIKATTTEKLGFEGREEGISAMAVCLLQKQI